jgi:mannonate dehydratase
MAAIPPEVPDGIRIATRIPAEPTDVDFQLASRLGVEYVYIWLNEDQLDVDTLTSIRTRAESHGLTLFNAASEGVCKNPKIHLALPGRDEAIEAFATFIRNLAAAGVHTTTFTWEPARVRSSESVVTRGGAIARAVNMDVLQQEPSSHEGDYSEDDIWRNFEYFIERIIPVAEEVGVRLALHPNDPPVPSIGGIPCLIHNMACHQRAFEICDSDYLGMEFCTGCWLEGGQNFGEIFEGIRHFVERGKVFIVHFRNVSSPLPHFAECFIDDGYMDMHKLMKAFHAAGYRGTIVPDHVPQMDYNVHEDDVVATAHAIGYMKALLEQAQSQ